MANVQKFNGSPFLYDSTTGEVVGVKSPDGTEMLFEAYSGNIVTGPGSGATVGHLAVMGNTSGTSITDGGAIPTVPLASSTTPSMDGTAAVGAGTTWAKGDHVHPTDTSRSAVVVPASYPAVGTGVIAPGGVAILHTGAASHFTLTYPHTDGLVMTLIAIDGQAYTVQTPATAINSTNDLLTFGGDIGDSITLYGYGSVWYVLHSVGVIASIAGA
jgi:hypothetical protein